MAVDTFSLGTTGYRAGTPFNVQPLVLGDATGGRNGTQAAAMATGAYVWVKEPDGSQRYYAIDAERSRPGGPVYLLKV